MAVKVEVDRCRPYMFILSATAGTVEMVSLAKRMLEEVFSPYDPRAVHKYLTPEQVVKVLAKLKPVFIHHPECKKLIAMIMRDNGVDLDKLYFDLPPLRSAYTAHFLFSGIAYAFHPPRDRWYSAPMCQLNWWMSVYPLHPDNSMGFYTRYFTELVQNNSEIYNYYEWNTHNRASAAQHVKSDTRQQPRPQQDLQPITMRYLPPPACIILFSGAQLHERVRNTTDVARYSIDCRTAHLDDVTARRGRPNVDSRCTGTTLWINSLRWICSRYLRISSARTMTEARQQAWYWSSVTILRSKLRLDLYASCGQSKGVGQ
jgi:hypothetical protein